MPITPEAKRHNETLQGALDNVGRGMPPIEAMAQYFAARDNASAEAPVYVFPFPEYAAGAGKALAERIVKETIGETRWRRRHMWMLNMLVANRYREILEQRAEARCRSCLYRLRRWWWGVWR